MYRISHMYIKNTTCVYRGTKCVYTVYRTCIYRVPHVYMQGTTSVYTGYHMSTYRVPHMYIQGTTFVCTTRIYTMYHICIYKVPHVFIQGATCALLVFFVNIEPVCKLAEFRLELSSGRSDTTMTIVEFAEYVH